MRSPKWWVSLAAGAAMGLAFPPFDGPWPLIPIAIAVWFRVTHDATAVGTVSRTLAFGMGFYLVLLKWMTVVGIDAWFLLALLQSAYLLIVAAFRFRFERFALVLLPLAWVVQDLLRDHAPHTAFGWGQLAFANIDAPWTTLAQLGHQEYATAGAVLAGIALARLSAGRVPSRLVAFGVLLLALTLPLLVHPRSLPAESVARIALVQAGVDHTGLGFLGDRRSVLFRHRDLTIRELRNTEVVAVLWPENASDADPFTDPIAATAIRAATDAVDRPLLLGAVIDPVDGRKNVSLLAHPGVQMPDIVYQKQRLVPFGEFLPLRAFLERVTDRVAFLPRDFVAGTAPGRVRFAGKALGIVICFEVADEAIVRNAVGTDAVGLIVQTNNATYAGTGQSEQQLRIAQLRARMFGVPVYVISTNGPTAVIDAHGVVVQRIDEGDTGVLLAALADGEGKSE